MMQDCIFCKIVHGSISANKIYENDSVLAFLDVKPLNPGHTLVIPKKHFNNFSRCKEDILAEVIKVCSKTAEAVQKATNADGFNVLCNNQKAAGQVVEHVHFHIIPRYKGDGVFDKWPAKEYRDDQAEQIAAKIKNFI